MATRGLPAWPWERCRPEDLPPPERLLLDGARLWAEAQAAGRPGLPALRLPFAAEDAPAAAEPLDRLLRIAAGVRPLGLGCPLCPTIGGEEILLLLGCALAQRVAPKEALAVFAAWLPPAAACAAMPPASRLGAALRQAGLLLHRPLRPQRRC